VFVGRADPTPPRVRHHGRGRITKQGNTLVAGPQWTTCNACDPLRGGPVGRTRARLAEHRGANIAKVAAARKLLTLVYWGAA
jgi:hypothetical protein